jgi:superfamily II DNA or RNA helicase
MTNPEYTKALERRRSTFGIEKTIKLYTYDNGDLLAPRGFEAELYQVITKVMGENWHDATVTRDQTTGDFVDFGECLIQPFEDQGPMINALFMNNGVGIAPAGSGKTVIGLKVAHSLGVRTLWLTHTRDLMEQTKQRAETFLKGVGRVGRIGDGIEDLGDGKLIIATVQTLKERPDLIEALNQVVGLVVVDEAHHWPAPLFLEVGRRFKARRLIGLTATPDRKDQLEKLMYTGIGPAVYEIKRDGLYESGRLIKPKVKFIYTDFVDPSMTRDEELENVDAGGEDLAYHELIRSLINDRPRLELVARNIVENYPGNFSIVLAESVRYLYYIQSAINNYCDIYGIRRPVMAVVHGGITQYAWRVTTKDRAELLKANGQEVRFNDTRRVFEVKVELYTDDEIQAWQVTAGQRKTILQRAADRKLEILFATQLAREGLDFSHLSIGHLALPKRGDENKRRDGAGVEQYIGRLQRPDPKNPDKQAIWFDYVDHMLTVFYQQYLTRRKVYKRIGLEVPNKPRTTADQISDILGGIFT